MNAILTKELIPLSEIAPGTSVKIDSFLGGTGFKDKLLCQGIIPGQIISVINSNGGKSPVIIKINDTKVMIGSGMTSRILVEKTDLPAVDL
ncbi:MAG: ferrous iron transport protein A [Spirochaetes bacterium]|nr:ferrous iron transport protein A [Spirochaetota bacterium]